ncbi:MAG: immunoglobulin-like domain-containing protein, partial [Eubacteriales bacterium]
MIKKIYANKLISRALSAVLSLSLILPLSSCTSDTPQDTDALQITETPAVSEPGVEKRPTGEVDADAKNVDVIAISSAEELSKIGNDKKYPLDGDYVLVADIDLSDFGFFTPIGGSVSECGIVEGDNVFTGTFDGRGHTIYALSIDVSSSERVHVGLFGSVGSKNKDDPAEIKNLILKNVSVTGNAGGPATYAALAGQVDGYAKVDNIALICGKVEIKVGGGDILGIGSLIGQCRTQDWTGCSNNGISITNIFTNLEVIGENNGRSNYTSGLIGRIRASDLGTLANVLQIGSVTHENDKGNAIAAGDSHAKVNQNVYYRAGCAVDNNYNGKTKSVRSLLGGETLLDTDYWSVTEGSYPMLKLMLDSSLYSELDFVTLTFADGESAKKITSDFTLPTEIFGREISWVSGSESVIKISGENAEVTKPSSGQVKVTLKAYLDGAARSFTVNVDSGIVGRIVFDGENTLSAENYPAGTDFRWTVVSVKNGRTLGSASSGGTFTLDTDMLNSIVTLSADGFDDVHFYYSTIPSVSIESDTAYYDVS